MLTRTRTRTCTQAKIEDGKLLFRGLIAKEDGSEIEEVGTYLHTNLPPNTRVRTPPCAPTDTHISSTKHPPEYTHDIHPPTHIHTCAQTTREGSPADGVKIGEEAGAELRARAPHLVSARHQGHSLYTE